MEIDVDCGDPLCATLAAPKRCPIGGPCLNDADCATGICDEHPGRAGTPAIFAEGVTAVAVNTAGVFVVNTTLVRGRCVSCTDGTCNADETGVDCGSGTALAAAACPRCPDGSPCVSGADLVDHALLVYYDIIGTAGLGGRREPPGYGCMRVINGSQYFWTLALEDKIPTSQTKDVVEYKAQALAQIDDLINLVRGKMTCSSSSA